MALQESGDLQGALPETVPVPLHGQALKLGGGGGGGGGVDLMTPPILQVVDGQLQDIGLLQLRQGLRVLQSGLLFPPTPDPNPPTHHVGRLLDQQLQLLQTPIDPCPALPLQQRLHHLPVLIRPGHGPRSAIGPPDLLLALRS